MNARAAGLVGADGRPLPCTGEVDAVAGHVDADPVPGGGLDAQMCAGDPRVVDKHLAGNSRPMVIGASVGATVNTRSPGSAAAGWS